MTPEEKIRKAMASCERAINNYESGNLLLSQGDINFIISNSEAAFWLIDSEIKMETEE